MPYPIVDPHGQNTRQKTPLPSPSEPVFSNWPGPPKGVQVVVHIYRRLSGVVTGATSSGSGAECIVVVIRRKPLLPSMPI